MQWKGKGWCTGTDHLKPKENKEGIQTAKKSKKEKEEFDELMKAVLKVPPEKIEKKKAKKWYIVSIEKINLHADYIKG